MPGSSSQGSALIIRASISKQSERRMFAEQIELPRGVGVTFGRDGSVVAADLGEMAFLEFQGELHQRVRNVSGGFIGNGILRRFG
jgi:hypothetical protein